MKRNYILIIILLTGFLLRVGGFLYGYPLGDLVGDEPITLLATLKMIGQYSLRPASPHYYYPALLSLFYLPFIVLFLIFFRLTGYFTSIEAIQREVLLNFGFFIPWARIITLIFAVLSIYLIYKITIRLFKSQRIALISALFFSTSFLHIHQSHFATTWIPQTFFIMLAFWWAILLFQKEKASAKDYILAGILIGIAFGINFVGILTYFYFLLAHFLKRERTSKNFWLMNIFVLLLIILVYYLNPYGLNNYLSRILQRGITSAPDVVYKPFSIKTFETAFFYLKYFLKNELIYSIIFIPAIFFIFLRKRTLFYFLGLWIAVYFLFLIPLTNPLIRYTLPIVPFVVIVNAYFINWLIQKISPKKSWQIFIILLIISYPIFLGITFDQKLINGDTRVLARNWVYNNIPSGAKISDVDLGKGLELTENKDVIRIVEKENPALFSTKRKYLLKLAEEDYPQPNYFVASPDLLPPIPLSEFDYIVLRDFDKELLQKKARELPENAELIKYFYPASGIGKQLAKPDLINDVLLNPFYTLRNIDMGGPYIEIYKIKKL